MLQASGLVSHTCTRWGPIFFLHVNIFQHDSKAGLCPLDKHEKTHLTKSIVYANDVISLVVMCRKALWLVQENHTTVKLDSSIASRGKKTYRESRIELGSLQILKPAKCWKSRHRFWHQSSPVSWKAWTLPWTLPELKSTLRKLAVTVNTWGHSILNERTVATVERQTSSFIIREKLSCCPTIFLLYIPDGFLNHFDI